jgi:phage shock protein A
LKPNGNGDGSRPAWVPGGDHITGILNRITTLFHAKVWGLADRAEDPRDTLVYACERQQELLANVRRALVEVTTSKHQIAAQIQRLEQRLPQLEDQARRAVAASRDDLARLALERRQRAARQLDELRRQLDEVTQEEQKVQQAERRFAAAVEAFRARRDLLSARYTAAEAQYEAQAALAGLSGELTGIGAAVGRAEEKIDRMQARAAALDQLLAAERVEDELERHTDQEEIEKKLAELKQAKGETS